MNASSGCNRSLDLYPKNGAYCQDAKGRYELQVFIWDRRPVDPAIAVFDICPSWAMNPFLTFAFLAPSAVETSGSGCIHQGY
jgi:hypothetical protein